VLFLKFQECKIKPVVVVAPSDLSTPSDPSTPRSQSDPNTLSDQREDVMVEVFP
jgi:hypothetical protein